MKIYLVRHGQTLWNQQSRLQGILDSPLTQEGILQAEKTASLLFQAIDNPIEVLTSPLGRALQTAHIISKAFGVNPLIFPDLREIDLGQWNGKTYEEINEVWPTELARWRKDFFITPPPANETLADLSVRMSLFLDELKQMNPQKTYIVVSHKVASAVLITLLKDRSLIDAKKLHLPNAGFECFEI